MSPYIYTLKSALESAKVYGVAVKKLEELLTEMDGKVLKLDYMN